MDGNSFSDLAAGCSNQFLAEFLRVSPNTIKRWKTRAANPPHSALLALRWYRWGDLSTMGGKDWAGFRLSGGLLTVPHHHRPFRPEQLCAMFYQVQELASLRGEVRRLAAEVDLLRAELARERVRAEEYRALARQARQSFRMMPP